MSEQTRKSVEDLLLLSRVKFLQNFEEIVSNEILEYMRVVDSLDIIDTIEDDNSMQYAYNHELPYIF